MSNYAEAPLTRITIKLFTADVEELKRGGEGYQTRIRDIVHAYVQRKKAEKERT